MLYSIFDFGLWRSNDDSKRDERCYEYNAFPRIETLISDSQEAKRNTKQLMKALSPFWEGIIDITKNKNEENESKTISYNGYIRPVLKLLKNN